MKKQMLEYCSPAQIEQYLLNKMSLGEETLFQMHLEICKDCRMRINSIRRLSYVVAGEELAYIKTPDKKKQTKDKRQKKIQLWTFVSIAACITLVIGISFFRHYTQEGEDGISVQKTYMNQRSKADRAEMTAAEILFPDKEVISLPVGTPLVFKWNREANYKLIVKYGDQTIIETTGFGESYTLAAKKMQGLSVLNWSLSIENNEFKGQINIVK